MNKSKISTMNISRHSMKKTDIQGSAPPQLQIEFINWETLGSWWSQTLPGIHWRLYRHSAPGAALILPDGTRRELEPGFLYLTPPYRKVESQCEGNPKQLFIHFILNSCFVPPEVSLLSVESDRTFEELTGELEALLKRRNPSESKAQLLAISIVSLALNRLPPGILRFAERDSRISRACRDLRENPGYSWSNSELAERYGLSADAFTRRFRQIVGITPYHYLQTIRYALAAQLLESTDLSIGEVCERIGVNDPFHFSREFKRFHERSPSLYRAERQKK